MRFSQRPFVPFATFNAMVGHLRHQLQTNIFAPHRGIKMADRPRSDCLTVDFRYVFRLAINTFRFGARSLIQPKDDANSKNSQKKPNQDI